MLCSIRATITGLLCNWPDVDLWKEGVWGDQGCWCGGGGTSGYPAVMLVQSPGVAPADESGYLAQVTGLQWNLECPISVFYSFFSVFLMLSNIYGHKIVMKMTE